MDTDAVKTICAGENVQSNSIYRFLNCGPLNPIILEGGSFFLLLLLLGQLQNRNEAKVFFFFFFFYSFLGEKFFSQLIRVSHAGLVQVWCVPSIGCHSFYFYLVLEGSGFLFASLRFLRLLGQITLESVGRFLCQVQFRFQLKDVSRTAAARLALWHVHLVPCWSPDQLVNLLDQIAQNARLLSHHHHKITRNRYRHRERERERDK